MYKRLASHIVFWITFAAGYGLMRAFFAGPSDLVYPPLTRFLRFWLMELCLLPWKILPYYGFVYWVLPKFYPGKRLAITLWGMLFVLIGIFTYRFAIPIVNSTFYGDQAIAPQFSFGRLLYTFTEMLPAFGVAATVKLLKHHFQNKQIQEQLRTEKLENELSFLKAQTNPHFLFNTLNNIYGLARRRDDNTASSILQLSNIMRYILYECSEEKVPIRK
ncbi:MAG: histidine kinase, partial [Bacteroidota bacterium]